MRGAGESGKSKEVIGEESIIYSIHQKSNYCLFNLLASSHEMRQPASKQKYANTPHHCPT